MGLTNPSDVYKNNNHNNHVQRQRQEHRGKKIASTSIIVAFALLSLLLLTSVFVASSSSAPPTTTVYHSLSSLDSASSSITTVSTTPPPTTQQPSTTQQQQQLQEQQQQELQEQQQQLQEQQQQQLQEQQQQQLQEQQLQQQQSPTTSAANQPQQQQVPTATPTSATTQKNTPVTIQLSGTISSNNALQFSISSNPAHGTLSSITQSTSFTASVTYIPQTNFAGSDSFSFRVIDTATGKTSSSAKVSITVTDQPPTAYVSSTTQSATTLKVTKLVNCIDYTQSKGGNERCQDSLATITEDQFPFQVTGNNPVPSRFKGSESGTVVTLDPGDYIVTETTDATVNEQLVALERENVAYDIAMTIAFTGNCFAVNPSIPYGLEAKGTIAAGESQTCNVINTVEVRPD